jgi:hypothetical protein
VGNGDLYYKVGVAGIALISWSIQMLLDEGYSRVIVVEVPGNHDWDSTFWVTQATKIRFENDPRVEVMERNNHRNSLLIGGNLLEWRHGNFSKAKEVASNLSFRDPKAYSEAVYRAIYLGHHHKLGREQYADFVNTESAGVDVWSVPSMCPPDVWHDRNEYVGNTRRSAAFKYRYEGGLDSIYFADIESVSSL